MKIMLCQTKQRERAQKENKLMLCPTISHNFIQDIDVMILTPFRSARRNWPWCCLVRQSSYKCGLKSGIYWGWNFCIARVLCFHDFSQSQGASWNITRISLRNPKTAEFWHWIIDEIDDGNPCPWWHQWWLPWACIVFPVKSSLGSATSHCFCQMMFRRYRIGTISIHRLSDNIHMSNIKWFWDIMKWTHWQQSNSQKC